MAGMYEKYRDDLTDFVRGRLDQGRSAEILQAAQSDNELREAIETERTLDRWMEYYEVPEISGDFQARFWRRFHEQRVDDSAARGGWVIKLLGPLAAGVLIAVGVVLFMNNDTPPENTTPIAEHNDNTAPDKTETPAPDVEWQDEEITYLTGQTPEARDEKLSVEDLELLKKLDDAAFKDLDELDRPEDLILADELDTIDKLAEDD